MAHDTKSATDVLSFESANVKDTDGAVEAKTEEKRYKCTFEGCNLAFLRPSRLKRHIRVHTGERCFKCDYPKCNKAYSSNCHLQRHMKTHNAEKKLYKCSECSLYLTHPHNLKRHYNTMHMDHDKLTCKVCNETFTKKYQLKTHMNIHTIIQKCDKCNKSFTNFAKFKKHKKCHEQGNKQYPCTMPECNEVFTKYQFLCAHLKAQHVNDYKCKDCSKVFLNKAHLKMHSQVHEKKKFTLSCPIEKCPRVYYFERNLVQHVRIYHLGQKFECDICKIKIGTKSALRKHIEKLHLSERIIKQTKKLQRKKRKDAGIPKRSTASKLIGINLAPKIEKMILKREENIVFLEQFNKVSNDDPDSHSTNLHDIKIGS